MARKNTVKRKQELIDQQQRIEKEIAEIENRRIQEVGQLAKKAGINDLSDEVLKKAFKEIYERYQSKIETLEGVDDRVKKPSSHTTETFNNNDASRFN